MINPKDFYDYLQKKEISHYFGVPDSLLKNICSYIDYYSSGDQHIITANEGNAIAMATGYHLATKKIGLVYFQNSGFGNAINPLVSLVDKSVYSIPMLLMIGWRGEAGIKDEPQHVRQGEITLDLLKLLDIPYEIIDSENFKDQIQNLIEQSLTMSQPVAMVIRKNLFDSFSLGNYSNSFTLVRESALEIILKNISKDSLVVSTTGKSSREIYEIRERFNQTHSQDFLTVGSMGHVSSIALGLSLNTKKSVYCIDGDGSMIMHLGALGIMAQNMKKNLKYILINNESHESVGGQSTITPMIDFQKLFKSVGFSEVFSVDKVENLNESFEKFNEKSKSALIVNVKIGSRSNLGRPKSSPVENKNKFMKALHQDG